MVPERQFRTPLFDALVALAEARKVSFHTPGHKSGKGISTRFRQFVGPKIFTIDLTTLDEVDCLQKPVGVIKEAQELAAEAYGADHSFFLVNGTTVGNQAMILATAKPGDQVLVARNAHKSILAGIVLSGAIPRFFLPELDPELGIAWNVTGSALSTVMELYPQAKILCLTSPNYYGVAADLSTLIAKAKAQGMLALVDEAHGPHLRFHPDLPPSALESGADICVQSTHKIVGGMTQASMLHIKGDRVDLGRLRGVLYLLQSTSPSYILMASLDLARMQMATEGRKLLGKAIELAEGARARINRIEGLYCLEAGLVERAGPYRLDVTKLTISTKALGLSGFQVSAILNAEFGVQVEMADLGNLLVIVSIGDRKDDLDRLVSALTCIATRAEKGAPPIKPLIPPIQGDRLILPPREAYFAPYEYVEVGEAAGRVSSEVVTLYPPGIPLLVPGEEVSPEVVDYLLFMTSQGARVDGVRDSEPPCLRVLRD
ncbi:MAG: aminotransferase class I/II-fold pyridoxal phosphate-dependent enzyme [candidate division NC10 bacterium]|nr:aminotransferase class I/II-fold pyridoxal phosphate-dependent enzyme [candidate division NC10 bacterium]